MRSSITVLLIFGLSVQAQAAERISDFTLLDHEGVSYSEEPVYLPEGTSIVLDGAFDNSAQIRLIQIRPSLCGMDSRAGRRCSLDL